ncbi:MAG: photosynthetic protein synthase I [Thermogutta sp.]|nr:MAG: photosynthetic protein synthase I [Thermogutta sp.]
MSRDRLLTILLACGLILLGESAKAQLSQTAPNELEGVGVDEKLGNTLPLDLEFTTSEGRPVRLKDLFDGKTPVLLTLNYSNCPKLCHLQLNGLFEGLESLDWTLGGKFRMITVSINPEETTDRAAATKRHYLSAYQRPEADRGWFFLTGKEENIKRLANSVGFYYRYDSATKQFIHPAVTIVCTPEGKISRYLYGVEYPAQNIRLALLEASEGKIGTTTDRIILFCFHYDPTRGTYTLAAYRLMQVGGALTVCVLGAVLAVWWWRERTHRHADDSRPKTHGEDAASSPDQASGKQ